MNKIISNIKSGITVALVSIPLSISLAIASHVSPIQGIITGIWAGLIASLFGGSNFNIIGPTGALSGVIAAFVLTNGIETVSLLAIITGIIILIAYLIRLERYLVFIPSSVIHGFTLGVACIIALNQLNFVFGLHNLTTHETFIKNIWESITHIQNSSLTPFFVFLIFFGALLIVRKTVPKIPAVIVLSPIGIALGYLSTNHAIPLSLDTLGTQFGNIEAKLFQMPTLDFSRQLFSAALVIAFIAILETMLSAIIADAMTKTRHKRRQEIFGLGLANIASGLTGGIPATAALARTALNIKSGATHARSATISSIFLAIGALLFLYYFTFMPMAVIAAMLVNVAVTMIEFEHFDRLFKFDKTNFFISLLVAAITIYLDPIAGILTGSLISLLLFVEKLSHGFYELTTGPLKQYEEVGTKQLEIVAHNNEFLMYSFKGKLSYINGQAHITRFEENYIHYKGILLHLRDVNFIDIDGIDAFDEIVEIIQKRGQIVLITGASPQVQGMLTIISKKFSKLATQGMVFNSSADVLQFFKAHPVH